MEDNNIVEVEEVEVSEEKKKTTIADLTVNQFMWRVVGWLIIHVGLAYALLIAFLYFSY